MRVGEIFVDKETKEAANQFAQWCLIKNLDFDEQRFKDLYDGFIAGVVWEQMKNEK